MRVIELMDDSRNECVTACVSAWYIAMKRHKILFVTGEPGNFWGCSRLAEVPMDEIDLLFLPSGCQSPLRELECFLKYNDTAKIYLSRANNETRLRSISNKLIPYNEAGQVEMWEKRVIFMDRFVRIGDEVQIFTEEAAYQFCSQNMIVSEDGIKVLFVNGGKNAAAAAHSRAMSESDERMDYFFYSKVRQESGKQKDLQDEQAAVIGGNLR